MSLHPLSVPYKIVSRGLVGLFFLAFTVGEGITQLFTGGNVLLMASVGGLFLLLVGGYVTWEVLYYRMFRYRLSEDQVEIESGVFFRREREIPVRRIQNVDVKRNLVHRMLDIAAINLESAGGEETEAALHYVSRDEARRIQDEIRTIKQNASDEPNETDSESTTVESADRHRFTLNGTEFALFCLLPPNVVKFTVIGSVIMLVDLLVVAVSGVSYLLFPGSSAAIMVSSPSGATVVFLGFLLPLIVLGFVHGTAAVSHFLQYYDFKLYREGDSLEYERGLLTRKSGSIPTDKIQKLTIEENIIMRYLGYVSLSVETAGYGPAKAQEGQSEEAVVPMARKDRALELAHSIEGFESPQVQRPPKRVSYRYGLRYTLLVFLGLLLPTGTGIWGFQESQYALEYLTLPGWLPYAIVGSIVLLAPFTFLFGYLRWKPLGYAGQDNHFLVREGYLNRVTTIIPFYRIQTITDRRSFLQRRWNLSTVIIDTAGSFSLLAAGNRALDVGDEIAKEITDGLRRKLNEALN